MKRKIPEIEDGKVRVEHEVRVQEKNDGPAAKCREVAKCRAVNESHLE